MDRMDHVEESVIDLGVASIETKGPPAPTHDTLGGIVLGAGISDE